MFGKLGCLFAVFGFGVLSTRANLDLSSERAILFMDELISFDNVRALLYPGSFKHFLGLVFDGGVGT